MSTTTYTGETGCLIGGHEGVYGILSVIEIAQHYGFEIDADDQDIVDDYRRGSDCEYAVWIADDAEEYLNEHIAPEGYQFGWYDGEFYLSSDEQWGEEAW